MFKINQIH